MVYTQAFFHSGRTDCDFGHHDYQNTCGLGLYHWHHSEGPHLLPHIVEGKSLIDLFKSYNGSACTTIKPSSGAIIYICEGIIELEKDERYFTLQFNGLNGSFYLISDKNKEFVESFWGTELNPVYVKRDDSPWNRATGGFDIFVNANYFKALVKKYCGLEQPPQLSRQDNLGYFSGIGESNNDPSLISSGGGDSGGKSYGAFQFASNFGIPLEFVNWLEKNSTEMYTMLMNAYNADGKAYGSNFDSI